MNVEANNRQLHQTERDFAKANAKKFAQHYEEKTGQKIDDARAEQMLLFLQIRKRFMLMVNH